MIFWGQFFVCNKFTYIGTIIINRIIQNSKVAHDTISIEWDLNQGASKCRRFRQLDPYFGDQSFRYTSRNDETKISFQFTQIISLFHKTFLCAYMLVSIVPWL